MTHQDIESIIWHRLGVSEIRISIGVANANESAISPNQIRSDNYATPVVFEPLGRVDAAHLSEASLVGSPQCARRSIPDPPVTLAIPWPCPGTDLDIGN